MIASRLISSLSVVSLFLVTALPAQSLKQRELIAQDKSTVAEHLADANKTCGSHVTLTTDYSTFADVTTSPDNPNQQSPWAFIVNVTDAMDTICRGSDEGKAAIASKLKSVSVTHATTQSLNFSAGHLSYAVPYKGAAPDTIVAYLKANL